MCAIDKVGKGTLMAKENTNGYLKSHLAPLVGGTSFGQSLLLKDTNFQL